MRPPVRLVPTAVAVLLLGLPPAARAEGAGQPAAPAPTKPADAPARQAPTVRAPGDVNGRWWGQYAYADPRRPVVTFSILLDRTPDGKLRGTVDEELSDFGAPAGATRLASTLYGSYDGRTKTLRFLKVYEADGRQVEYTGKIEGDEVRGSWTIPGTHVSGTFFLRRAPASPTLPAPL